LEGDLGDKKIFHNMIAKKPKGNSKKLNDKSGMGIILDLTKVQPEKKKF